MVHVHYFNNICLLIRLAWERILFMRKVHFLIFFLVTFSSAFSQQYSERYEQCSESLKELTLVDSVYLSRAIQRDSCLLGTLAPDFKVTSINGKEIHLSKLRGQVVMLNFWFIGCIPCIEEIPDFNKLVDKYSSKEVTFISFTYDSVNAVKEFLKTYPFKFIAVSDDKVRRERFNLFGIWPYTIVIDKNGTIRSMLFGGLLDKTVTYYTELLDKLSD